MFVDEYQELHDLIVRGKYPEALALIADLDAMGRKADMRVMRSYMRVLLAQLLKRAEDPRPNRSWDVSIKNSVREIN